MSYERFVEVVEQALALGFSRFELTPCTGDVYMDRTLMRKLAFLDEHAQVASYEFFTNFTIPKPDTVSQLATSELMHTVEHYRAAGHEIWLSPGVYNNWGGYITGSDVAGLDMQINSTEGAYKYGACEKALRLRAGARERRRQCLRLPGCRRDAPDR